MPGRLVTMSRFDLSDNEPRTVCHCAHCGFDIYAGDEVMRIDDGGGFVHNGFGRNCAEAYAIERMYDASGVINERGEIN